MSRGRLISGPKITYFLGADSPVFGVRNSLTEMQAVSDKIE
jgi:hypothetical protein